MIKTHDESAVMVILQGYGILSHVAFQSVFQKGRHLQGGLSKFFTVCNFGNTLAMTIIFFFSKCLKLELDSRNGIKNSEKVFCLSDNFI